VYSACPSTPCHSQMISPPASSGLHGLNPGAIGKSAGSPGRAVAATVWAEDAPEGAFAAIWDADALLSLLHVGPAAVVASARLTAAATWMIEIVM
ncbi:MAG: hypothetical protein ACREMU_12800, partial [Gemmatimonadaceae bacterium]